MSSKIRKSRKIGMKTRLRIWSQVSQDLPDEQH